MGQDIDEHMKRVLARAKLIIDKPKFDPREVTPEHTEHVRKLWATRAKNLAKDMRENPEDYEEDEYS